MGVNFYETQRRVKLIIAQVIHTKKSWKRDKVSADYINFFVNEHNFIRRLRGVQWFSCCR